MNIDDIDKDRYTVVTGDRTFNGWAEGWKHHNENGSPSKVMDLKVPPVELEYDGKEVPPLQLDALWPDNVHYEGNTPGIMRKAQDLDRRKFRSWLDKAWWNNVLRVPLCASYMAGLGKVLPETILELGVGGDSAHSTGMFLYWLEQLSHKPNNSGGVLVSVDRHPLSTTWPRYRAQNYNWHFFQGDTVRVMHEITGGSLPLPRTYDLIFIDSSHQYGHTLAELNQANLMTNAMLLDDVNFDGDAHTEEGDEGGVKRAVEEFMEENPDWLRVDLHGNVALLERHPGG